MALLEAALLRARLAVRSTIFGAIAGIFGLFAFLMFVAALCVGIAARYGPVIGLLSGGGVFLFLAFVILLAGRPKRGAVPAARPAPPPEETAASAQASGLEAMAAGLVGEEIARRPYGSLMAAVTAGALIGLSRRRSGQVKKRPPAARPRD